MSSSAGAKGAPIKSTGLHIGEPAPGVKKVDPIIVADNITRTFGGLTAVQVDHLEIPRGAITALIGPNGAGKTTLFNLLTGFDKPDTGEWTFDGKGISGIPAFKVARKGQVRTFQLTVMAGSQWTSRETHATGRYRADYRRDGAERAPLSCASPCE